MPIFEVHLVEGDHTAESRDRLLTELSRRYATLLDSPIDRVRGYLTLHAREHWTAAGERGGTPAPYFTAIVLEGRPVTQRQRLLAEFTDLIVEVLGVERGRVRGRIIQVHPDDWAIGGVPASGVRADEIAARAHS